MSKGLEELKRLAYENACCRCQYYIEKKCTNKGECVWKTIEKELKALNEIVALHDKWLGNEMSDFEFFTLLNDIKYKYGLENEVLE